MNALPKITIGMAAYRARGIARAIESLLNQTYRDFVLDIFDDNSPEGLEDVVRPYAERDPRVRYVRYAWNVGGILNFARQALVARTEYFMWATDDDQWHPEYLQRCVDALERDPDAACCYTGARLVDEQGNFLENYVDRFRLDMDDAGQRLENVMRHLGLCHSFFALFRTRFLQSSAERQSPALTLATRHDHVHDALFLADLALTGKFLQIEEPLLVRTRLVGRRETTEQRNARLDAMTFGTSRRTIRLSFIRFAYNHLELVQASSLPEAEKARLVALIPGIFASRWGNFIVDEMRRAIDATLNENYHLRWGESPADPIERPVGPSIMVGAASMLRDLQEAAFLLQDFPGLALAQGVCHARLGNTEQAIALVRQEYRKNPDFPGCREIAEAFGLVKAAASVP